MPRLSDVVLHGDCIEVMESMEDNSIDAIVSDPPYGISFMGKNWDKFTPKSFQEFSEAWGIEALRILKPGGYCLAFSGTRTYHRMVCGLEDAGFKIKDQIIYCYGSGFPKSLDISKAIDQYYGKKRKVIGEKIAPDGVPYSKRMIEGHGPKYGDNTYGDYDNNPMETAPATKEAQQWQGWGTGLKPSFEPIVVAQKPYIGTYAENVLKYGVGGLNIDASRIQYQSEGEDPRVYSGKLIMGKSEASKHTVGLPGIPHKYGKPGGRFPSNLLLTHHPECKLIGNKQVKTSTLLKKHNLKESENIAMSGKNYERNPNQDYGKNGYDTVEAYDCHPACPIRLLDEQSGESKSISKRIDRSAPNTSSWDFNKAFWDKRIGQVREYHNDKGGASRFFKTFSADRFIYSGKAHKSERNAGLLDLPDVIGGLHNESGRPLVCKCKKCEKEIRTDGRKNRCLCEEPEEYYPQTIVKNNIATLKPISVLRYLVRLVTPPNGLVLDPFAGSGTTGIACIIEGFHYILIEKRKRFAKTIIPKRLEFWKDPSNWSILKDHNALPKIKRLKNEKQNKSIEAYF